MGGDSLGAIGIALEVEKRYGLKVDPVVVYERPVVREFAEAVVWMLNNPAGM
jgi:acyl carrier protein